MPDEQGDHVSPGVEAGLPGVGADETVAADIADLVARTEVRDIRLQRFVGELLMTPPDEIQVRLSSSEPRFSRQEGVLLVLFSHKLEYFEARHNDEPEVPVGSIEATHIVEVELRGDETPSDEAVSALVGGNVLFMVYPYVRAALHRLPSEFGLPPILLPYLRRSTRGLVVTDDPASGND